jgi:hypothetical protein
MTNLCGSGGSASPKPMTGMVNALGTTRSTSCYQPLVTPVAKRRRMSYKLSTFPDYQLPLHP